MERLTDRQMDKKKAIYVWVDKVHQLVNISLHILRSREKWLNHSGVCMILK